MQPLAGIANALGEGLLDEGVDVLGGGVDGEVALVQVHEDVLQPVQNGGPVLFADDALLAQHGGVGHAAVDVLAVHPGVKPDAGVEIVHAGIDGLGKPPLP